MNLSMVSLFTVTSCNLRSTGMSHLMLVKRPCSHPAYFGTNPISPLFRTRIRFQVLQWHFDRDTPVNGNHLSLHSALSRV